MNMNSKKYYISPDIWRGMVRDYEGRWEKYVGIKSSHSDSTYFFGKQDWKFYFDHKQDQEVVSFVNSNTKGREFLDENLEKVKDFKFYLEYLEWLKELHCIMKRNGGTEDLHWTYCDPTSKHTIVVFGDVIPIAKRLGDPYPYDSKGPNFNNIPEAGLPCDVYVSSNKVRHYYPHPIYYPDYLRESLKSLKKIIVGKGGLSVIAYFYQSSINSHLFELGNNSLFMCIVNYLLNKKGCKGVEHGILDFVSFRLNPNKFAKYFEEEVGRIQK